MLEASKQNGRYCILKTEGCFVFAGHIDLRKDKQLLKTVEEMTTHSHMRNKEDGKRIFEFKGYTESLKIIDLEGSQSKARLKTDVANCADSGALQHKIWDPGGNIQTYDQVVMNFFTWGV